MKQDDVKIILRRHTVFVISTLNFDAFANGNPAELVFGFGFGAISNSIN